MPTNRTQPKRRHASSEEEEEEEEEEERRRSTVCLWVLSPLGGTPRTGRKGTPPRRSGGRLMPGTVPVAHFHVKANGPWTGEPSRGPNDPASVKSSRGLTLQPFGFAEYKDAGGRWRTPALRKRITLAVVLMPSAIDSWFPWAEWVHRDSQSRHIFYSPTRL